MGNYGADSDPVDYILGITYEIWEEGNVDFIDLYYSKDCLVWALDNVSKGSAGMIEGTRNYLKAYPDRLLLGENVIWSPEDNGFYSSHRILSPMTNQGDTIFGPATNQRVRVRAIANCLIQDGKIVEEWLIRDALPLVSQLGFDPIEAARKLAEQRTDETSQWFASEIGRVREGTHTGYTHGKKDWLNAVLTSCWQTGDSLGTHYPHYAVLHRSPIECHSGIRSVEKYYAGLRDAFSDLSFSVDHVAELPFGTTGTDVAARWTIAAKHTGEFQGIAPTGRDVVILGTSHYRLSTQGIATEWQVFDGLAVMAQLV